MKSSPTFLRSVLPGGIVIACAFGFASPRRAGPLLRPPLPGGILPAAGAASGDFTPNETPVKK